MVRVPIFPPILCNLLIPQSLPCRRQELRENSPSTSHCQVPSAPIIWCLRLTMLVLPAIVLRPAIPERVFPLATSCPDRSRLFHYLTSVVYRRMRASS